MAEVQNGILDTTKKLLGIHPDDPSYDGQIVTSINSVFATLQQLGVGPIDGFSIEDNVVTWDAYLLGDKNLNQVKSYMYLRVRLMFDPPSTSFAIESMQKQADQMEWRLQVYKDPPRPVPAPIVEDLNG